MRNSDIKYLKQFIIENKILNCYNFVNSIISKLYIKLLIEIGIIQLQDEKRFSLTIAYKGFTL